MTNTKLIIGTVFVAGVLAAPLLLQQRALARERSEQAALNAQLSAANASTPTANTPGAAPGERADLDRLRREAAALRTKISELAAEAHRLEPTGKAEETAGKGTVLTVRDTADVGQATPAMLFETWIWAEARGKTNRMTQLFAVDTNDLPPPFQRRLEQIGQEAGRVGEDALLAGASAQIPQVRIVGEEPADNGDRYLVVERFESGNNAWERGAFLVRPSDSGWRFVVDEDSGEPMHSPRP